MIVSAGMSINGRTYLHIIKNGALTAARYGHEIFRLIVVPYAAAFEIELVFMDDNAWPHRARLVAILLFVEGILRMDWPAYSPDISPIEHI